MSSIDKMLIRGVRSFSSNNDSTISFAKPLTLIVGKNGSGKTTIIECLKYATTGEAPPGKLQAFLSHPKVLGERELKSQIKLRFNDLAGRECVIVRNLEVKQTKMGKLTTRTIDSAIRFYDEDGARNTMAKKCGEVDEMVPRMLGVSKAVLEYVIFCHQEDEWVLAPPNMLKARLDSIFAATRYRQALKDIKVQTKAQLQGINVLRAELQTESTVREQARRLESTVALVREEMAELSEQREQVLEQLAPIEAELAALEAVAAEVAELEHAASSLDATIEVCTRQRDALLAAMTEQFEESDSELLALQKVYEAEVEKAKADLVRSEAEVSAAVAAYKAANDDHRGKATAHAALEGAAHALEAALAERKVRMDAAVAALRLPAAAAVSVAAFGRAVDAAMAESRAKVAAAEASARDAVSAAVDKVQALHVERAMVVAERDAAQRRVDAARQRAAAAMPAGAESVDALRAALAQLEVEHDTAKAEVDRLQRAVGSGDVRAELARVQLHRDGLKTTAGRLRAELNHRAEFAGLQAAAESKAEAAAEKDREAEALVVEHGAALGAVAGWGAGDVASRGVGELGAAVAAGVARAKDAAVAAAEASAEAGARAASARAVAAAKAEELGAAKAKAKALAKTLAKKTDGNDLVALIAKTQGRKETLQARLQTQELTSSSALSQFEEFAALAKEKEHCPLCRRAFASASKLAAFVAGLEETVGTLQAATSSDVLQQHIDECTTILAKLDALRPVQSEHDRLVAETIPRLEAEAEALAAAAAEAEDAAGGAAAAAAAADADVAESGAMAKVAETLVRLAAESGAARAAAVEADGALARARGGGRREGGGGPALDGLSSAQLGAQAEEAEAEMAGTEARMAELERRVRDDEAGLRKAEDTVRDVVERRLTLEAKMSKAEAAESTAAEVRKAIAEGEAKVAALEGRAGPVEAELRAAEAEKKRVEDATGREVRGANGEAAKVAEVAEWLSRSNAQIAELEKRGSRAAVAEAAAAVAAAEASVGAAEARRAEVEGRVEQMRAMVAESASTKRLIDDNVAVRRAEKELRELEGERSEVGRKLAGVRGSGGSGMPVGELRRKKGKLASAAAELKGTVEAKRAQAAQLEAELGDPLYANGQANYAAKLIEMKTTEMAAEDLTKYERALDAALQRYHALKVAEINNIIKELWQKIYKNADIDTIEIACTPTAGKKSSYEYALNAVRDGVAIPMRARCSAGQARIASLIVRIALAETFCLNCGILALDEPTTNLDVSNKISFARALATIVNDRSRQSNFQLLLITHDESFVETLTKKLAVSPTHFWAVGKDSHGFSEIRKTMFAY